MRRAWLLAVAVIAIPSQFCASASAPGIRINVNFERQEGRAVDWTPAAPVKRTLGIAWDERARAGGMTAVFARSVTVTYSLAPGLSLSREEADALARGLEASVRAGVPSAESPAVLSAEGDAPADYRSACADRLLRLIEARGPRLASAAAQPAAQGAVVLK